ncbi:hypothetical protein L9F63_001693, partial [Diploptera punctata]
QLPVASFHEKKLVLFIVSCSCFKGYSQSVRNHPLCGRVTTRDKDLDLSDYIWGA